MCWDPIQKLFDFASKVGEYSDLSTDLFFQSKNFSNLCLKKEKFFEVNW